MGKGRRTDLQGLMLNGKSAGWSDPLPRQLCLVFQMPLQFFDPRPVLRCRGGARSTCFAELEVRVEDCMRIRRANLLQNARASPAAYGCEIAGTTASAGPNGPMLAES